MIVQKQRDEESGLLITDRYFQPMGEHASHALLWTLVNALVLGCLVLGLLRLTVTGFAIPVAEWFYPAAMSVCLLAAVLCQSKWCGDHWAVLAVPLFLAYVAMLFVLQTEFLLGMAQLVNRGISQLNSVYSGTLSRVYAATGVDQIQIFLIFAVPIMVLWLSIAVLRKSIPLMMELLVFPAVAALLLFQAADDMLGKFVLLLGVVLALAFSRTKRQRRMWGGEREALANQNRLRYEAVQKRSALLVLALSLMLAVPCYLLVRPLLSMALEPAARYSTQLQTEAINRVIKLLPDLTAGRWNLNVEAVGGGVQDGALNADTGYLLEGVEDLRLTLSSKPTESLFLRGFIGAQYADGSWQPAPSYTFDGAAINWNTEGSARLYIQNLPFLRTAFAASQANADTASIAAAMANVQADPVQLYVERINANAAYTYVPYGAYLNDYYQVEAGDGSITGQRDQEDRFFCFTRQDMERVLKAWNDIEDTANVLDRVEESYRAFCNSSFTSVAEGLNELQAEVDAAIAEHRWQPLRDIDEITQWIRRYMVENYEYHLFTDPVPEGEDALRYFLFTSKRGNSIHYASAAVVLYRMFGIPARYVVGYEVLPALFTVQAGGMYTAIIQGDNSQAWAEIYVPGIGWTPQDMTPGVIGTLEEVGLGGIVVEAPIASALETATDLDPVPEMTESDQLAQTTPTDLADPDQPGATLTLAEVVRLAVLAAASLLCLTMIILLIRKLNRDLALYGKASRRQLLGVFQAVFRRAKRLKLPAAIDSQDAAFTEFVEAQLKLRGSSAASQVKDTMDQLYRSIYRGVPVMPHTVKQMRSILLGLYKRKRQ